jgi:hypothetical protein
MTKRQEKEFLLTKQTFCLARTLASKILPARTNFPAVKLNDGRILIIGGFSRSASSMT